MADTTENPSVAEGIKKGLHGNLYQLKLLMYFALQGIKKDYSFELGSEISQVGGNFEDVVYGYQRVDGGGQQATDASWHYRYLQAKHKQDEKKNEITATQLLNDNGNDFSLAKYFRSYRNTIRKKYQRLQDEKVEIEDCIMCTNIGFEEDSKLKNQGIVKLPHISDDILHFSTISETKAPARYKLERTDKLQHKMKMWSNLHLLANTLLDKALVKKESLTLKADIFKRYHVTLVDKNNVIEIINDCNDETAQMAAASAQTETFSEGDQTGINKNKNNGENKCRKGKLSANFLNLTEENLTEDVKNFRQILVNETFIDHCKKVKTTENIGKSSQGTNGKSLEDLIKDLLDSGKVTVPDFQNNLFVSYYEDLKKNNVIESLNKKGKKKLFTKSFIDGNGNLSEKALQFRNVLSNLIFSQSWENIKFQVSETFGTPSKLPNEENLGNEPLNDSVEAKDIEEFLDKLVFAVHTPNEDELGKILNEMVGKNYKINESDFQKSYILEKMLDWLKNKDSKWFCSEDKEELLNEVWQKMESVQVSNISEDYQDKLEKTFNSLSFNKETEVEMATTLNSILLPNQRDLWYMRTPLPKWTAVEVLAALKHVQHGTNKAFETKDSYIVTSSSRLENENDQDIDNKKKYTKYGLIKNVLIKKENPQKLLIIVRSDEREECPFDLQEETNGKKILVIVKKEEKVDNSSDENLTQILNGTISSRISYKKLSDPSRETLLSTTISFQMDSNHEQTAGANEKNLTIDQLIGSDDEQRGNVLDALSIEELMLKERQKIEIPAYNATSFERSLYIDRKVRFDFDFNDSFWENVAKSVNKNKTKEEPKATPDELQKQCKINSNTGKIEWIKDIDENLKKEIWERILERTRKLSQKKIPEDELLVGENWKKRAVIISGVAGTGKSTLLSHFYEEIKKEYPDHWVIRINLTDHQKALEDFDFDERRDDQVIFDFLVQLPTVLVGNSPFARSLLRHRLKTGDRIVLMLDGYDEIDSECQKKTIQLFNKSIVADKTRSIGLFVTTRSHMVDTLHFELGQLAYTLDAFDQQNQIDCITKFWSANSKIVAIKGDEHAQRQMARNLVDGVTNAVKGQERQPFVGIPLQCRIVAEYFLTPVEELILAGPCAAGESNGKLEFYKKIMDEFLNNFSPVSMYRHFMEKKKEIFRREKVKAYKAESHCANRLVDRAMADLERDLIQLAITTIVSDDEDASILLGGRFFQSDADREKEESKRDDDGVLFGLLDKKPDAADRKKKKTVFLHRTYAEFLVADYLYKGFHLDDKEHNKLLDNEPARHFIIAEMLAGKNEEYNVVQIFLDFMFGELIDTKGWQDRVNRCNSLPDRYHQFTKDIVSPQVAVGAVRRIEGAKPLLFSGHCRKEKIFLFLCDALDATCERQQVKQTVQKAFSTCNENQLNSLIKPNKHGNASAKVFARFSSYFEDEEEIKGLIKNWFRLTRNQYHESYWNGDEQKEIVRYILDLFQRNSSLFNQFVQETTDVQNNLSVSVRPTEKSYLNFLSLFMWNENYHDSQHLQTYLELLMSKTELYETDGDYFAKLFNEHLFTLEIDQCVDEQRMYGKIDKMLDALRVLNRLDLAVKLWSHLLVREPEACKRVYLQHPTQTNDEPIDEETEGDWLKKLLIWDEWQTTWLHRAAFGNQKENVKEILDKVKEILMSSEGETLTADADDIWSLAQQVVSLLSGIKEEDDLSNENDGEVEEEDCWDWSWFTPFHVAIACHHEEIYDMIISFLNKVSPNHQDILKKELTAKDGFLHQTLKTNLKFSKVTKVEWILKFVKQRLGQDCLLNLLKLVTDDLYLRLDSQEISHAVVEQSTVVYSMGTAVATSSTNDYGNLNELSMYYMCSSEFFKKLSADEIQQLLETITKKRETNQSSYWLDFIRQDADGSKLTKLFQSISKSRNIDANWVSKLVWSIYDEENNCIVDENIVVLIKTMALLVHFPPQLKDDVRQNSKERAQKMIQCVFFSSSNIIYFHSLKHNLPELFHFYLDYGSHEQLKKFFDFVTADRHWQDEDEERQSSFWAKWMLVEDKEKEAKKLFKRLSEISRDVVEKLLIFLNVDRIPFFLGLMLMGIDVHADILSQVPKETQEVVEKYFQENVPNLIDDFFQNSNIYFDETTSVGGRLNVIRLFLEYANDNQLTRFRGSIFESEKKDNIWNATIQGAGYRSLESSLKKLPQFMDCVMQKLGPWAVRQFIFFVRRQNINENSITSNAIEIVMERYNDYADTELKRPLQPLPV